ncbi:hypothetical protein DVV91_10270 [Clostridium botulinum]|uniref:hypothetical protein n=1 Tax=Clostridium botulinum TaxID=1491 RepID=UPI0019687228|nr:hypothetical protein [Clostridium botulinum]MBN1074727.1 hypothetical protein [Clostridium botulinum]
MKVIDKIMESEEFKDLNRTRTLGHIIDNYCPKYFDCMQRYSFGCKGKLIGRCLETQECWCKEIITYKE